MFSQGIIFFKLLEVVFFESNTGKRNHDYTKPREQRLCLKYYDFLIYFEKITYSQNPGCETLGTNWVHGWHQGWNLGPIGLTALKPKTKTPNAISFSNTMNLELRLQNNPITKREFSIITKNLYYFNKIHAFWSLTVKSSKIFGTTA